jgi:DNA-binding transcriptional MerR regulator
MLTVTALARTCGLSRSTILYYERIGLLKPAGRSLGGYRRYGQKDVERLRQICIYRNTGVPLAEIRKALDSSCGDAASVLRRRLADIDAEISRLREHQRSILRLLGAKKAFKENEMITKDKWVAIMRAAGFTEQDMNRWHAEFERSAPAEHQEFLEFIHIPAEEIAKIREWPRGGKRA